MRVITSFVLLTLVALSVCLAEPGSLVTAQTVEERTRKLWDTAFIKASSPRKSSKATVQLSRCDPGMCRLRPRPRHRCRRNDLGGSAWQTAPIQVNG